MDKYGQNLVKTCELYFDASVPGCPSLRMAVRCFRVGGPYLTEDGNEANKWIYLYFILSYGKGRIKVAVVTGLPLPQVLNICFDQTMVLVSSFLKLGVS